MTVNKSKLISLVSWLFVVLWMFIIFSFSAQPAEKSSELSRSVTTVLLEVMESVTSIELDLEGLQHFTRKNAHFFAYLILGVLTINAFERTGVKGTKSVVISLAVCILYAISDEFHQTYVPGRSGEIMDVVLDSVGAVAGIGLYQVSKIILKKK